MLWELIRPIGKVTMAGVAIGAGVAIAATTSMRALLYGVTPIDLPTFVVVPLSIVLIAAASVLAAAWPIVRTDPAVTLRQ